MNSGFSFTQKVNMSNMLEKYNSGNFKNNHALVIIFYATETYFTHFLEDARFPKAPGFSQALKGQ